MKESFEKSNPEREQEVFALAKKLSGLGLKGDYELHDEIVDFAAALRKKYPDYFRYKLYHALSGSTPEKTSDLFDFPEADSIERFVREKLKQKNTP